MDQAQNRLRKEQSSCLRAILRGSEDTLMKTKENLSKLEKRA
tara:strand:+ start:1963 stop:2088 length:126 start_codon:yes stop_codon:yes gene_type:complete